MNFPLVLGDACMASCGFTLFAYHLKKDNYYSGLLYGFVGVLNLILGVAAAVGGK
jgi:hypothetical protein